MANKERYKAMFDNTRFRDRDMKLTEEEPLLIEVRRISKRIRSAQAKRDKVLDELEDRYGFSEVIRVAWGDR